MDLGERVQVLTCSFRRDAHPNPDTLALTRTLRGVSCSRTRACARLTLTLALALDGMLTRTLTRTLTR